MKKINSLAIIFIIIIISTLNSCEKYTGGPGTNTNGSLLGHVFVLSNQPSGNNIFDFYRDQNGYLELNRTYSTMGFGSANDSFTQGSLSYSPNGRYLFVANAGDSSISSFSVNVNNAIYVSKIYSQGTNPVSLTLSKNNRFVYVLNRGLPLQHIPACIYGYTYNASTAQLDSIPNSKRVLPDSFSNPSCINFVNINSGDNYDLVVTETDSNKLVSYTVNLTSGLTTYAQTVSTNITNPVGVNAFSNFIFVAGKGTPTNATYSLDANGNFTPITTPASVQSSAYWVAGTKNGTFRFFSDYISATITSFALNGTSGSLTLAGNPAVTQVNEGIGEMAINNDDRFLYTYNPKNYNISFYTITASGGLIKQQETTLNQLPLTTIGMAAW
ncbi:MAG: beta-propeller fold lactonase family protein [Phycisphaerales bacterium]|nr:beta-propeller fold lactonase family protein [Phycisphaerales bacterium]